MTTNLHGVIIESRMENSTTGTNIFPYKPDSLKQATSFTTTAHLTLRVPVKQLDTLLYGVAAQAGFIDARVLQLEYVTLQHLSNQLKEAAAAENDLPDDARQMARKTADVIAVGDYRITCRATYRSQDR